MFPAIALGQVSGASNNHQFRTAWPVYAERSTQTITGVGAIVAVTNAAGFQFSGDSRAH
jgi:hypothetical protein